jgi:hypothetical protein
MEPITADQVHELLKAKNAELRPLTQDEIELLGLTDDEIRQLSVHPEYVESAHRRLRKMVEKAAPPPAVPVVPAVPAIRYCTPEEVTERVRASGSGMIKATTEWIRQKVVKPIMQRFEKFEKRLEMLEANQASSADASAFAEIQRRLVALENKAAGMCSVARLVEYEQQTDTRLAGLNSKVDKEVQTNSAQSRHIQSLEKKFGELAGRGGTR